MISYADCVPILLTDTRTGAVGAVHGGWRGSVGKIVPHALEVMKEAFGTRPQDVAAGIGPSNGPCCYEVSQEVADRAGAWPGCLTPHGAGHWMLDLWQLNTLELLEAGVPREQIFPGGLLHQLPQGPVLLLPGRKGENRPPVCGDLSKIKGDGESHVTG